MTDDPSDRVAPRVGGYFRNNVYDVLKYIAMVILPAAATLYFALSQIWGLPYPQEVVGTITAVDTFLGFILKLSHDQYMNSNVYYDGALVVKTSDPEKDLYSFEVNQPLESLKHRNFLNVQVKVDPNVSETISSIVEPPVR